MWRAGDNDDEAGTSGRKPDGVYWDNKTDSVRLGRAVELPGIRRRANRQETSVHAEHRVGQAVGRPMDGSAELAVGSADWLACKFWKNSIPRRLCVPMIRGVLF
jgi:hypothetical protein